MDYEIKVETVAEQPAAAVVSEIPVAEVGKFIGEAFGLVMAALQEQHSFPAGPPFARYQMHGDTFEVTAGFPVAQPIQAAGRVVPTTLQGGSVATTMHVGAYDKVAQAYNALMAWLPQHDMRAVGDPMEIYLDGPEVAEPRTIVRVPCEPMSMHT